MLFGDLTQKIMVRKLITFGTNGLNVFHNLKIRVTMQLKEQNAPFMINVHCMNHLTNLAMQTFFKL